MYPRPALRASFAVAAVASLAALGLSACSDPGSASNAGGAGTASASASGGSNVTTTWGLKPVDSVAALVPAEFKDKTIQNGIYNDFAPQDFEENGQLVGIQPDIVLAMSEVMGVKVNNVSVGTFDSLIPGLSSGRYDVSSADFGVTKPRLGQVDFVSEFAVGTSFAAKTGSSITVNSETDLCGHTIGVLAGSYFIDQVNQASADCTKAGKSAITLQTYPDDGARILAVTNGRSELTATTTDAMAFVIKSQNVPLTLQKFVYEPLELGIALKKGSSLGPAMKAAMKEIISNGTYAKILKKWGVDSTAYTSPEKVTLYTSPSQLPAS
ncbi:ABC transporter substrate-binding protein [Sinomonas sp. JGH33]|uniref:ABC transporter substrate-binding protein n=1 Tax=Sinomonas terricola TaxID=3110330 RepID=A0ABU5T7U4_9MICC|nr:ABC transporter substrate-binding protein [Sinomonas sp. JGH33]MEA5455663.1 ABC transporter substrate-binding protein [Sinomonas sp. JGH33]